MKVRSLTAGLGAILLVSGSVDAFAQSNIPGGSADPSLYWTDHGAGKIQRANLYGSGLQDVLTGVGSPYSIALDPVAGKLYWSDDDTLTVYRADLDGSNDEALVSFASVSSPVALDPNGGKLYWRDSSTIRRANLDGTGAEDVLEVLTVGIALDLAAGKLYWIDLSAGPGLGIRRANLDGSNVELIVELPGEPVLGLAIALDLDGGKVYWAGSDLPTRIWRANLDGSGVEPLVATSLAPFGLALDLDGGKVHWTHGSEIQRADLDGSNVENLLIGFSTASGIAILAACSDGLDNDGDGFFDSPDDPGCDDATDPSERSLDLPCDDGRDNDSDGRIDFDPLTYTAPGDETTPPAGQGDPGCWGPTSPRENPQCQDGLHNDGDGKMDYDGGRSIYGVAQTAPDPQCVGRPWKNRERANRRCGLGYELALFLPPFVWLHRRRRRMTA